MGAREVQVPAAEQVHPEGGAGGGAGPDPLDDPRALTILTTEHWGLLSARALVYNEAFARAGMFLTFLSASLVALAFASGAMGLTREFLVFATVILALDLFIGLATLGRVAAVSSDDLRCLAAMNRIRHAYLEVNPGLARYISGGRHDDLRGIVAGVYGDPSEPETTLSATGLAHSLTTTPGMVATITSAVAGALAAAVALLLGFGREVVPVVGLLGFAAAFALMWTAAVRTFLRFRSDLEVRFPSPPAEGTG